MPVGGKALHATERVVDDRLHHVERHRNDLHEGRVAEQCRAEAERHQEAKGGQSRIPGDDVAGRALGDGVDQLAGKERGQYVCQGGQKEAEADHGHADGLFAPMGEGEAEDVAKRVTTEIELGSGHETIRMPLASPVPTKRVSNGAARRQNRRGGRRRGNEGREDRKDLTVRSVLSTSGGKRTHGHVALPRLALAQTSFLGELPSAVQHAAELHQWSQNLVGAIDLTGVAWP